MSFFLASLWRGQAWVFGLREKLRRQMTAAADKEGLVSLLVFLEVNWLEFEKEFFPVWEPSQREQHLAWRRHVFF